MRSLDSLVWTALRLRKARSSLVTIGKDYQSILQTKLDQLRNCLTKMNNYTANFRINNRDLNYWQVSNLADDD
jgi:hypothetical protein